MTRRTWNRVILVITAGAFLLGASCQGPQSPTGVWPRFAYVANGSDGTVSIYTVHAFSGQLRHNGYTLAGTVNVGLWGAFSVTADSAGELLYVVSQGSSALLVYRIDSVTGNLTPLSTTPTGQLPYSVAVDPFRNFVYVSNGPNQLSAYTVSSTTGSLPPVPGSPFTTGSRPVSVVVHPTGNFVYVANLDSRDVSTYQVNRTTGSLTAVPGSPFAAGFNPVSITVDPSGKFAYVANFNSDTVSAYTIDATTGALTHAQDAQSGREPQSVAVDPAGKFVYVANSGSNDVSAYTIDGTTGALTEVLPRVAAVSPVSVTVDPSGQYAYVVNGGDVSVYWINSGTGALTPKGRVRGRQTPLAIAITTGSNPVRYTPKFAYVAGYFTVRGYQIDSTTGTLTSSTECCAGAVGTFGSGQALFSVAAYPPGQFARAPFAYAANWGSDHVLVLGIDPTSGALTQVGTKGAGTGPSSVAVDPSGRFAYVVNDVSNDVRALHGPPHRFIGWPTGKKPRSVVVDPTGQFMYVANNKSNDVSMYRIDPAGGTLTALGTVAAGYGPIAVTVHPSGRFAYVVSGGEVRTYAIDAGAGTLTAVSTVSRGNGEIAVDPSGQFAYVLESTTATIGVVANILVFRVDPATGALNEVLPRVPLSYNPGSVTVDPSGRFVYVASFGSSDVLAYTIDPTTGSLTWAGTSTGGIINSRSVTTVGIIE